MRLLDDSKNLVYLDNRVLETYAGEDMLLPEVPSFGCGVVSKATLGGPRPVFYEDVYEVCYIEQGSVEWWFKEIFYEVGPGNLFINRPGEWHGGKNAFLQPCEVYWVQIALPSDRALPGLSLPETELIRQAFVSMTYRFFAASPEMKGHFERLLREYRHPQADSALAARAILHEILVCVGRDHARYAEQNAPLRSSQIQQALDWMEKHIAEDCSVETVAQVAGMSAGYFHTCFLQEVGYTPAEYRTRRRVTLAKQLLRDQDLPVTEIGLRLGFSTSQYFSTVFRKIVGITPREYRLLVFSSSE